MDIVCEFENAWSKFQEMCRAKLLEKNKQCILTVAAAELAVQDAVALWFDVYHICGQWLRSVKIEDATVGEKIEKSLCGIKFETPPVPKGIGDLGIVGITVGGAVAGAGIGSWLLHLGTVGTVLSAVVPAVVLYPSMKTVQKNEREKAEKVAISKYLEQLIFVKDEILGEISRISQ